VAIDERTGKQDQQRRDQSQKVSGLVHFDSDSTGATSP